MNTQSLLETGLFLLITTGRLASILIGVVALVSIVIGRQALIRSNRGISSGRPRALMALVTGLTGMLFSVVHLALSTGGFGTGSGRAGAIVALVVGLIGTVLGGLALARSRRVSKG